VRRRQRDCDGLHLVGVVANRVALALGVPPVSAAGSAENGLDGPAPPSGWSDPWLLGALHEQVVPSADRKARGAWYTPRPVVQGLVALATPSGGPQPELMADLTCGGGGFLLACLDRLVALGADPLDAVSRVVGMDLDPDAVTVSRWAVQLWLAGHVGAARAAEAAGAIDVRLGDSLVEVPARWRARLCVVGNPPFASPLKRGAVPASAAAFRAERADLLGPYADLAAAHLLRAVELAPPGSTVLLVQPQSILSSRDTRALRRHLDEVAPLNALWAAREPVFDAGVRACAPLLAVGGRRRPTVTVAFGPDVTVRGHRAAQAWGGLGADALGAPTLPPMAGQLGDLAPATAGFRDEHYGLVAACREADPGGDGAGRVITVGSVDPLCVSWGREPLRFGGRYWSRPVIDREALGPKVGAWYDRQRRPKVLLATQTKLLEPVVDRVGHLVPATPLIAVHAQPEDLDRVAAVLLAPPVVLWAWRQCFGTALAVDAVKLAARQVAELPLPADNAAWSEASALVAGADGAGPAAAWDLSVAAALVMTAAYRAPAQVFDWWFARLKPRPVDAGSPAAETDQGHVSRVR
jgi:predicted RNA methylase